MGNINQQFLVSFLIIALGYAMRRTNLIKANDGESLAFLFAPANEMFRATLLVGFVLPIATAVIPYAVEFQYDKQFVGTVANLSILLSFALVWLLVGLVK